MINRIIPAAYNWQYAVVIHLQYSIDKCYDVIVARCSISVIVQLCTQSQIK